MVKTRKSWREKLENSPKRDKRFGGRRVLVPHGGVVLVVTPHLADDLNPQSPNFRIRVRAQRYNPDMFYVNEFADKLFNVRKDVFNRLF